MCTVNIGSNNFSDYGTAKREAAEVGIFNLTEKQKLILISLGLVDFTSCCAMAVLAPFFPKEAARKEIPNYLSGFVFGIYAFIVFLSSPFVGYFITYIGPKIMFNVGILVVGCSNIVFGFLDHIDNSWNFIVYCLIVRIFEALGASMVATASFAFVAQIFPETINRVLGILEICVGLGLSVGPSIGGILYDWGGYGPPFFFVGITVILTIPVNVVVLPGGIYLDSNPSPVRTIDIVKLPSVIIVCLVVVVNSNIWGFLSPTLEPHLREFDLSAKQLGLFFLLSSGLYALSSPLWGWLSDKMKSTWILMVVGLLISAFGLLLIGPSPLIGITNSISSNILALIILGISIAMALLPTFEAMLDFAVEAGHTNDLSTYGIIAGLWSSMESLGEVVGPSLGGFLMDKYGFPICSTVMAGICVIMAIVVLVYFQHRDPCSKDCSNLCLRQRCHSVQENFDLKPINNSHDDCGNPGNVTKLK